MPETPQDGHQNLFIGLRIAAASMVIFSHHFHITGTLSPAWLHTNMLGGLAVMAFFAISGYLVTLSWLREPRIVSFMGKRLLRLWPGMLVAVLADVLLFGLVFTALPWREFLVHPATLEHWRNLLLVRSFENLPGVFSGNPLAGLMNGPLWTIPMELMCYAGLAVAGMLGLLRWRWLACAAGLAYVVYFLTERNADFTGEMQHWFEYPAYFVCGSMIALFKGFFLAHARTVVLCAVPVAAILFFGVGWGHSAGLLLLPLLFVYLGTRKAKGVAWLNRLGDPSYGVYVLGCPIAQAVQAVWPGLPFVVSLLVAWVFAMAAGYASWHGVESPALGVKRYFSRSLGR